MKPIKLTMLLISIVIFSSIVLAGVQTKPIMGTIQNNDNTPANNKPVQVQATTWTNIAAPQGHCSCTTITEYSIETGEFITDLANLRYDQECLGGAKTSGDDCGDDWDIDGGETLKVIVDGSAQKTTTVSIGNRIQNIGTITLPSETTTSGGGSGRSGGAGTSPITTLKVNIINIEIDNQYPDKVSFLIDIKNDNQETIKNLNILLILRSIVGEKIVELTKDNIELVPQEQKTIEIGWPSAKPGDFIIEAALLSGNKLMDMQETKISIEPLEIEEVKEPEPQKPTKIETPTTYVIKPQELGFTFIKVALILILIANLIWLVHQIAHMKKS